MEMETLLQRLSAMKMFSTISLQQMATLKMKEKIKILLCLLKQ
jgi:hypothetical protein